jgi:putative DNA methylase
MSDDLRLIEDYLPIEALGRENTTSKGHPNTLHLWWARRPLKACRAAVYSALVSANRWVKDIEIKNPVADPGKLAAMKNGTKKGLNRRAAGEFVTNLCVHPPEARLVQQAQRHVAEGHAERLSAGGAKVTADDVFKGRASRPRVLDLFSGGGAIPLEAIRLGCEVSANELNPVAHIIELCALVYPQQYGAGDKTIGGMTGDRNANKQTTWGGLAAEVQHWGKLVFEKVREQIGDLYPLIPDPAYKGKKNSKPDAMLFKTAGKSEAVPPGYLIPVAYLWTRTVPCKKPGCNAQVPMLRQTWLCKRGDRFVAMDMLRDTKRKRVSFKIVESDTEDGFDFDPAGFSTGGSAACPFCSTVADSEYTKQIGCTRGFGVQPMAIMCVRPGETGKVYVPFDDAGDLDEQVARRLAQIEKRSGLTPPTEPLEANPRSFDVQRYGFAKWRSAFTERQNLLHLTVAEQLRSVLPEMERLVADPERAHALYTCVGLSFSRLVTQHNAFSFIHTGGEKVDGPWGDGKFPMSWDFAEASPFSGVTASYQNALDWAVKAYESLSGLGIPATAVRGSATQLPFKDEHFDAVITDPPYYDNYSYSNLSDAFYVWLKRTIGNVQSSHFASELTPKKSEAIKATYRCNGDEKAASHRYEDLMTASLREAHRVLKPDGVIAIVYAHKTTLGWSTLVDALRSAGFTIAEAWPLLTEATGGRKKVDKAMLASSIFLVARKRAVAAGVGNYEDDVQSELQQIVRERVETLWDMGIAGADLVIACVGAGLRAFTKYEKVEYANGEEVPAGKFLAEVEGVVLDAMLAKLSGATGGNISAVDNASRFYVLWRFIYKIAELDAGEAIVFSNGTHIELDGPQGLSAGSDALVEKKKAKYRMMDFAERGDNAQLGLPAESGQPASTIDVLHRILWLMENSPRKLKDFLDEARPDRERVRVLAQALAGAALSGKSEEESAKLVSTTPAEQAALGKLLANWRSLIESRMAAEEGTLFGKHGK